MLSPEIYILYGFLAFICLILLAVLGMVWRLARAIGELQGDVNGLKREIAALDSKIDKLSTDLNAKIDRVATELNAKIDRVEGNLRTEFNAKIDRVATELNAKIDGVATELNAKIDRVESNLRTEFNVLREQFVELARDVSEVKGMLRALYDRIDLVMRHRHLPTGEVILTPEELPAD